MNFLWTNLYEISTICFILYRKKVGNKSQETLQHLEYIRFIILYLNIKMNQCEQMITVNDKCDLQVTCDLQK